MLLCGDTGNKKNLGDREVVHIDFDIATFRADPFSEGSLDELLSMSGIESYIGVLLQLIPGCS